jgi:ribonucleotide reductase beta subunit family protein with ferritin-like domain
MTMTWRMLVKLELRRRSLPVVEAVLTMLKQPESVHAQAYSDFRATLARALEHYVMLLRDHYDLLLLENHIENMDDIVEETINEIVTDITRPP